MCVNQPLYTSHLATISDGETQSALGGQGYSVEYLEKHSSAGFYRPLGTPVASGHLDHKPLIRRAGQPAQAEFCTLLSNNKQRDRHLYQLLVHILNEYNISHIWVHWVCVANFIIKIFITQGKDTKMQRVYYFHKFKTPTLWQFWCRNSCIWRKRRKTFFLFLMFTLKYHLYDLGFANSGVPTTSRI